VGGIEQICDPLEGASLEICDSLDNDCDGAVDEDAEGAPLTNPCYSGPAGTENVGQCIGGTETCAGGVWGACEGEVTPDAEVCDAGLLDENCDGFINEECACNQGDTQDCGSNVGECSYGTQTCDLNGQWAECIGVVGPSPEVCDGLDNDCDGEVDEGVTTTYYLDSDGDGYGDGAVTQQACTLPGGHADNSLDCNDNNAEVYPNAPEICDGVDNQCPGDAGYGGLDENAVCGANDLIAWWTFDDGNGTTALDSSENGNDGILVNGPDWTTGQISGALEFDGVDDYVDAGTLDVIGNEMTISLWAMADSFGGSWRDNRLIAKAAGNSTNDHWWMLSTIASGGATRLRFRLKAEGDGYTDTLIASSGEITAGAWFHAVITYDGLVMRLYKDGQEVGNAVKSGGGGLISTSGSVGVNIGRNPNGYGVWDGGIDDVRIYDRALIAQEVLGLYTQGLNAGMCTDNDGDDYGVEDTSACTYTEIDCNDTDAAIHPGATEVCDGQDNDCDGDVDEDFNVDEICSAGIGECERTCTYECSADGTGTICSAETGNPIDEICDDTLDNDCDGLTDEDDPDC
jgi:hypothetical protein